MVWNRLMGKLSTSECARIGRQLQEYLDAEVSDCATRQRIRQHLETCRECGLEAHTYEEIKTSLHAQAQPPTQSVERLRSFVDDLIAGEVDLPEPDDG
ncbi:MAG: zf-HC2 domain-containing protein [Actinomycetia bacterium]|nr:zf-HC2 domain-containing protein [Actinomycetes bacterium]